MMVSVEILRQLYDDPLWKKAVEKAEEECKRLNNSKPIINLMNEAPS